MAEKKRSGMIYFFGILSVVFSFALATPARATLTLQVADGSNNVIVSVTDGGAGDIAPDTGAITYQNNFGSLTFNIESGLSKPIIGNILAPELHLNSFFNTSGPIDFIIRLSDTDFSGTGLLPFLGTIGGLINPAGSTITLSLYRDLSNGLFGIGAANLICTTGALTGSLGFSDACTNTVSVDDNYSLTIEAIVHELGRGDTSFDANIKDAPEPSAMLLLGIGLIGFGGWARLGRKEAN
ncbi:MAG TPA: PEP-CTERM sorting domain-containing protein [Candidatus Binatia bacterium]